MPTIKKVDIAWLAGIIDGEGSVIFHPTKQRGYHLCRLSIANTDEGILNEIRRILGEWLVFYTTHLNSPRESTNPCYQIEVNRQAEVCFVLDKVKPFLQSVKREKIKLILDYMNEKSILGRRKNIRNKNQQYGMVVK